MSIGPSRIDLLELDIDLRLTDLWREVADVTEWNLEVVAAFIRAAYGKGYCDALTEEAPGSLCEMLLAVDFRLDVQKQIVIVAPSRAAAEPLLVQLRATFSPQVLTA